MKPIGLILPALFFFSCNEQSDREAVRRNLHGSWKVNNSAYNPWGGGGRDRTGHPYENKIVTYNENGTWTLSDTVEGSMGGTYKVQPDGRSSFVIHMDCNTPGGNPLRKEYWLVSNGLGSRFTAAIERRDGEITLSLERKQ